MNIRISVKRPVLVVGVLVAEAVDATEKAQTEGSPYSEPAGFCDRGDPVHGRVLCPVGDKIKTYTHAYTYINTTGDGQLCPRGRQAMSLNRPAIRPIAARLAVATAATLNVAEHQAQESTSISTSVLVYQESDARVRAVEPMILVTHALSDESEISAKLVYDSLTGASPNGAMPASQAQTFTSPSGLNANGLDDDEEDGEEEEEEEEEEAGEGSYTAGAGQKPFDPSFEDTRTLIGLGWEGPVGQDYRVKLGLEYSTETDYESVSLSALLERTLNRNNTELSIGLNVERDTIIPFGDVPTPLSEYANRSTQGSEASRELMDVMLGVSHVFTRRWLSKFNLSFSYSSGYQEDPYKILTVVDDCNLIAHPTVENTWRYAFESRPETRLKTILYWQNKIAVNNRDVLDISTRYMHDDWGIRSGTLNLTGRWHSGKHWYLEPHLRYYRQTAADFHTPFLRNGIDIQTSDTGLKPLLDYAASDARLAAFDATTFGLKLGIQMFDRHEWSVRAEHYQQHNRNRQRDIPSGSDLDGMAQFTELSAFWVHTSYRIRW
jgi:hypothetical protein